MIVVAREREPSHGILISYISIAEYIIDIIVRPRLRVQNIQAPGTYLRMKMSGHSLTTSFKTFSKP